MKKKLKTKYLAGGPPQNSYFGAGQIGLSPANMDTVSRSVAGSVSALNQSQEQAQADSFKNIAKSAMSMMKKRGGAKFKYQTAGACPAGYAYDTATGQCLPDSNWVGSTPGSGVMAEQYLPGLNAAAGGNYQQTDMLNPNGPDVAGSGVLSSAFQTDPNAVNAASNTMYNTLGPTQNIVGNIGGQSTTAGKVTDLVEQGSPMANQPIKGSGMFKAAPVAGLVASGVAAMATNMTSDKNAATYGKREKAGTYLSSIAEGAAKGSQFGPAGMAVGAVVGAFNAKKAAREAENTALGIREDERALGVANREAFKNVWQGQQTGFGYNNSANMNMQGTSAYYGAKTGGVRDKIKRVPGGLIVPIKGTNAVEFLGNKHSESTIDGVSGIRIDKNTEVEHTETQQPVKMAKSGGSDSSKGKMRDYFFSAFLKLGGKSFAQRHKEILASGGKKSKVQALVQRLAQQQEAVANQNGEKDRSPDTIASPNSVSKKYGGIHEYQTGKVKKEDGETEEAAEENLNLLGYDIGKGEETGNTYIPVFHLQKALSEGSDKKAIKNWEDQQDPDKTYVRFTPSRPSSKDMKKKEKRQKLVSKMYEDAKNFGAFDGNEDSKLLENFNKNQGLALRRGDDSVFSSGRGRKMSDKYKKKLKEEEDDENTDTATQFMASGVGSALGLLAGPAVAVGPLGWPLAAGMALGPAVTAGVQAISEKRKAKMPTKYLNNSKVSDKEYENFKLYDTQAANAQSNAVANGVKPETTVNADGSVTVRGAQTADAVKESDGKFRVRDANGKVIAEGTKKNIVESQAQNIVMAEHAKAAKAASESNEDNYGQNSMSLGDMVEMDNGSHVTKEQYEKSMSGVKPAATPEASANAQSNADASNVTVRDQNQVNAQAPAAQESKAPGATSNNAGQAAADASAKAGTQDTTATTTSKDGTPVTSSTTTTSKSGTATTGNTGAPADKRAKLLEETQPIAAWEKPAQTKDKLGSTPRESIKSGIWSGDNYDKEWKPLVEETMADTDLAKKVYDYLTTYQGPSDEVAAVKKRITDDLTTSIKSIIENATDGDVGPFHNAVLNAIKSVQPKPVVPDSTPTADKTVTTTQETKEEKQPCPPGTFRNEAGECLPIPKGFKPQSYWSKAAGLTQYIAPVWSLLNPYQKVRGITGAPTVKAGPMPRVQYNLDRQMEKEENIAATNMVRNQSGIQAGVLQAFNNKQNANMLKISNAEAAANKQYAAAEMGMQLDASKTNAGYEMQRQMFNKKLEQEENVYAREGRLKDLQQIGLVTAGNYKDMKMYEATERLAEAIQVSGEYTRRKLYEALKNDPAFKNMPDVKIKEFANAYYNLTERPYENTNANESTRNTQKLGGTRKYTSRLGELTKRKSLNFSK